MTAQILAQIVIIDAPGQPTSLPVLVFTVNCSRCGEQAFVLALHHAKGLAKTLERLLANLPPELAEAAETLDTEVTAKRPKRPEDN